MKKIFIVSLLTLIFFSCGTTKNVVNTSEKSQSQTSQQTSMPFPKNDSAYQEAYSWRTNRIDSTMISLKNSNVDSLRYSATERYVSEIVRKIKGIARSDFEKAKMAHDIIALTISYDAKGYWSGYTPEQDYASVLRRGTAVCEGFSNTFKKFCDELNIPCRVVHGYARGIGSKAGSEPKAYNSNHAWNIITIKGKRYQVDCTWDEGFMSGYNSVKDYSTVWLFSQPETFIYTHFPENSTDQLLSRSISYQTFLQLPSLRPNFFDAISSVSDFRIVNRCNGNFALNFVAKRGQTLSCTVIEDGGSTFIKNADFIKSNGNAYEMLFSLPKATQYKISLFQQDSTMEKSKFCGEFLLNATSASSVKFPQVFSNYGLEKDGIVISPIETLLRGQTYTFKVQSKYNNVAVVIDGQWIYLKGDGTGNFTAEATIPKNAQKVTINVKNASGGYWSIVSYELK